MRYERTWRNKWLTADAKTIEDMIESLQGAVDTLKAMKAKGVLLDGDGTEDDYAHLVTGDPAVAKEYGLYLMEPDEDDEDDDHIEPDEQVDGELVEAK